MEHILGPLSHATVLGASFEHFLGQWGYVGIFVLSFISAMGLPVGAEVAVIYGGVLASGQIQGEKPLNVVVVIVVALVGELLGDIAGYSIGKFGGRPLVDRFGKFVLLTHKDLDRAEAWFARRGEPFALFGRFIPLLRSFVSFACGLGEMAFAKFMLFTFIGSAIWVTAQAFVGYSLGIQLRARAQGLQQRRVRVRRPLRARGGCRAWSTAGGSTASRWPSRHPKPTPEGR